MYSLDHGDSLEHPFRLVEITQFDGGSYDYSRPHRHNYYEIVYFRHGRGEHDIDFTSFSIEAPCLHFVSPGQVHQVRRDADSDGWAILFTDDFYYLNLINRDILHDIPLLNQNHPRPIINLNPAANEEIVRTINGIRHELENMNPYCDDAIRSLLNLLLITSRRLFEDSEGISVEETSNSRLQRKLRRMIERNFYAMHEVSAYAYSLYVTPKYLNDVVKRITGKTVSSLIQERILLEAKRLLAHSNDPIKDIASALGFDDRSYFSRFFRDRVGKAPGLFRKQFEEGDATSA